MVNEGPAPVVGLAGRDEVCPVRLVLVGEHRAGVTVRVTVEVLGGIPRPTAFTVEADAGQWVRHTELRRWADNLEEFARFAVLDAAFMPEAAGPGRIRKVPLTAAQRSDLERYLIRARRPRTAPADTAEGHLEVLRLVEEAEAAGVAAGPYVARAQGITPGNARLKINRARQAMKGEDR